MTTDTLRLPGSAAPPQPRSWFVLALAVSVLAFSLMQTMLVPALPAMQSALGVDRIGGGWILTAYLLAGAVSAPVLGAFGDRFGHRRILLIAMTVFTLGGVIAALAASFPVLLVGRVLQGASTASFPLALAIVRRHRDGAARASIIGWLSGTLGLGAGVALVIGGVLADIAPWPVLFWVGVAFGAAAVVLVAMSVPHEPGMGAGGIDLAGVGLLTTTLVGVLLVVSQAPAWGVTSPAVIAAAVVAVASFVLLIVVERRVDRPLLDIPTLLRPSIAVANVVSALLGFVPYLFYVALPILLQAAAPAGAGMSVRATGFAMLPGAILVFLGGRLAPAMLARLGAPAVSAIALALMAVGSAGAIVSVDAVFWLMASFAVMGFGNGIGFAVVAELIALDAPVAEVGALLGVNGVLRTIGSAFGAPVVTLVLAGVDGAGAFAMLFAIAAAVSIAGVILSLSVRRVVRG